MEEAIATHAARLGEKLRSGGLGTDHVTVFFHTSEHDEGNPQRSISTVVTLPEATSDTRILVKAATWGVRRVYRLSSSRSFAGSVVGNWQTKFSQT